jgi:hypothetical protein
MMGLRFKTKKAAKEALAAKGTLGPENIIETSFFGAEYKDGTHAVCVSLDPYTIRNSFAQIEVVDGRIVKVW